MIRLNFGAGPAVLPRVVLERASEEVLDFQGTGISVVELSHRTPEYELVHFRAMGLFRELMDIPETHEIIFMQGGTRTHFGLVPMNFLPPEASADYIVTGLWSRMAYNEGNIVGNVRIAGDAVDINGQYNRIPRNDELSLSPDARYVHICSNNTVAGTQWPHWPETGNVPLVVDMTSDIMSRRIDWSRIGLAYAGAQKNLGPAGVVVVVVRRDFLENANITIPRAMQYALHARQSSLLYTPSSFSVLAMQLVLEHAHELGGVDVLEAANQKKAALLYDALRRHPEIFEPYCEDDSRSMMNVCFGLRREGDTRRFLSEASKRDIHGLKGHRNRGGIRASIYNWIPFEHVEELAGMMDEFATSSAPQSTGSRPTTSRRQLLLKVEYRRFGRYHAEYVKNISHGGLLLSTDLTAGERIRLRLSFLGFLAPLSIDAKVRWSEPESDEGSAQSGIEFTTLDANAKEWLDSLLGGSAPTTADYRPRRVVLVESNSFLREVYSQELVNWAEVEHSHVELVPVESVTDMLAELDKKGAELAIIDLDGQAGNAIEVLAQMRAALSPEFPIIVLGGIVDIESLGEVQDNSLLAISKPLNFGQLMETVGRLFSVTPGDSPK